MSAATNIGRTILGERMYKYVLQNLYGIKAGNVDLLKEFNRLAIIRVLEWNETEDYLTESQVNCLERVIKKPSRNCNC